MLIVFGDILQPMLTFTDTAKTRIKSFLEMQKTQGVNALRIAGNRAEYKLWLVKETDKQTADQTFEVDTFKIFMDPISMDNLKGATVDFMDGVMQSGFRIFYPSPSWDDPLAQRVQDVLDQHINPGVAGHGGSVKLENSRVTPFIFRWVAVARAVPHHN